MPPASLRRLRRQRPDLRRAGVALVGSRWLPTPTARSTRSGASSRRSSSPASRAWCATSAWPRSWRRTRWWPRSSTGRETGMPGQSRRLADGDREAPRDRPAAAAAKLVERKHEELGRELEAEQDTARSRRRARRRHRRRPAAAVFTACHPVLSTEARVALTLRLLGGLTTDEIARAFLVPEPTIAQRIVRAKRTLAEAQVPFEVPRGAELRRAARLGARGHLPHLQRGLFGDRRRRLDAAGSSARRRCGSAASWPDSRRTSRRCTASSR